MLSNLIKATVNYGINSGLTPECERVYSTNLLLDIFKENNFEPNDACLDMPLEIILNELIEEAVKRNLIDNNITERDLFDTKIMNCLVPRPSQIQEKFWKKYENSPKCATSYFYKLSQDSNYIRRFRIAKDLKWKHNSRYGEIDISINLSKPEKDPKTIAAAKNKVSGTYPKCQLCFENEGYAGHINHPARENLRIIPITIGNQPWCFQYSPYVYYNEHCIVFNKKHTPMKIDRGTFCKLFDFVRMFPHYFIGSNADLPIVGGSILSHDHFQGGNYTFAMAKAEIEIPVNINGYGDVEAGILNWPVSVIRIRHESENRLVDLAEHILNSWRLYTDENAFIYSKTDDEAHNTITSIARKNNGIYELDLALRNNITTNQLPSGVYHPREKFHHIKKENIGLIEVMGLAVLPSRLKYEMNLLKEYILCGKNICENEKLAKHAKWANEFIPNYNITDENIDSIIQHEIGNVFVEVLEDAGVYKCTEEGRNSFMKFINSL